MYNKEWTQKVKSNFDNAADNYLEYLKIQKFFAEKIVSSIKELETEEGEWLDLGSGTGLLADSIEKEFSNQKVFRIDFSKKMLLQNKASSKKKLWDLNYELPSSINKCALITSNFCIHWLKDPKKIIKNWFSKLKPGGYLIISYPTDECFTEWKETCKKIRSEYSGLNLLSANQFSTIFRSDELYYSEKFFYSENFEDIYQLFRSIVNTGAHSSKCKRKSVKEFREMQNFWPKNYNNTVNLSWVINLQIIKKL